MRARLTLSGLQHAATCIGSVALPRFGSESSPATMGNALHEANARRDGGTPSWELLTEIADKWELEGKERAVFFARARSLDLQIPETAIYEVPLCLRADGTVEPVEGGRGSYEVPDDAIVAGTLDILFTTIGTRPVPFVDGRWAESGSVLWTPDLKTGKAENVAPIRKNWQARASALLGAKWTGASAVVPAIVFTGPEGGAWDCHHENGEVGPLRPEELEQIETDLRALAASAEEQAQRVEAGKLPKLVTGTHCTYCPARSGCPAHVAEARALATGETGLIPGPLTREQAIRGAGMLGPIKAATKALDEALKVYVETNGPLPLPDGRVFGPQTVPDTTYAVRALYGALVAELTPVVGQEEAERFADLAFSATREGIYNALRAAHENAGIKRQLKKAFDRVIAVEGVAETKTTQRWSAHYPKG